MGDQAGLTQATIEIDERRYVLAEGTDLVDIMTAVEVASRSEPTFVHLNDREGMVSVLVSPGSRVVVFVRGVDPTPDETDVWDTGQFGGWDL